MKFLVLLALLFSDAPTGVVTSPVTNGQPPPPGSPFTYSLSTNWVTNVLSTVRVEDIATPCPECGQPNHHQRHIDWMISYGLVSLTVAINGHTNQSVSTTGPTNQWMATNIVLKPLSAMRRQPGWTSPPPLPQ